MIPMLCQLALLASMMIRIMPVLLQIEEVLSPIKIAAYKMILTVALTRGRPVLLTTITSNLSTTTPIITSAILTTTTTAIITSRFSAMEEQEHSLAATIATAAPMIGITVTTVAQVDGITKIHTAMVILILDAITSHNNNHHHHPAILLLLIIIPNTPTTTGGMVAALVAETHTIIRVLVTMTLATMAAMVALVPSIMAASTMVVVGSTIHIAGEDTTMGSVIKK